MKHTLLLFLFLLFATFGYSINFRHIGRQEGLSQLSVMSIYQDELGRMWFGTLEGISVYDGVRTIPFKPSNTIENGKHLLGNQTFSITGDRQGSVFFTSDSALILYDVHQEKFSVLRDGNTAYVSSSNGSVWMNTTDSVFRWNVANREFEYIITFPVTGARIRKVFGSRDGLLWICTNRGLYTLDNRHQVNHIIAGENIYDIYEDSKSNVWVATRSNGMYCIEAGKSPVHYRHNTSNTNTISDNEVRGFTEDNAGNLWIATFSGLNRLNTATGEYTVFAKDILPGSLRHSSVFSLYKDKQGTIWVGTYYGGVHYFNPEYDAFSYYSENPDRNDCLSYPFVGHMVEDKNHNVWICTEGGGLNYLDRKTRKFIHYKSDATRNSLPYNNLKCIAYNEEKEKLYIGLHTQGLSIYDIRKNRFYNYYLESPSFRSEIGNTVTGVEIYGSSLIFLSGRGLFVLNTETEKISPLLDSVNTRGFVFKVDSKGFLWLGQFGQLMKINLKDTSEISIYPYGENGLGFLGVSAIAEEPNGHIYIGTSGSGLFLFDEETNSFVAYTSEKDMLQSDYVYHIAISGSGNLIITGDNGLTFFDPLSRTVKAVEPEEKLFLSGINEGCGLLVCRDGEIFVGGTDGLSSFYEGQLLKTPSEYQLYFSALYVNNELIKPGTGQILSEAIPYTKHIDLEYDENNLAFSFTSNNYAGNLSKTTYEYILEGFDTKWLLANSGNITYTNLNPGDYTLIVREKQVNADASPKQTQIAITIHRPWFGTPLAYLLYALVIGSILGFILRIRRARAKLQMSLESERLEKQRIEELNKSKLQFFANISHEFRTPLTLIISQIELLMQGKSIAPVFYNKLHKIYRNTYRLRELITELLDFRKLEQGFLNLRVSRQDIVPYLKDIWQSFGSEAATNDIIYTFTAPAGEIYCWYDVKQLQKVFYNLLSNAFKYTPAKGEIELIVEEQASHVIVKVRDTGTGIPVEEIPKIFDRFYQSENTGKNYIAGTGIGLSLVKGLVELHHGEISVNSSPGNGSIFMVLLNKDSSMFSENQIVREALPVQPENAMMPETFPLADNSSVEETLMENTGENNKATILIVEDNDELLETLTHLFAPGFHVVLAMNGKEGFEKAQDCQPDLILSDIMMPVMDGKEMCIKIKNNFELCHIPVVLLTALTSDKSNLEGLQCGADDYIGKPFKNQLLLSRCQNLIRNRKLLQRKFNNQMESEVKVLAVNPLDEKFLNNVTETIDKYLSEPDFDVETLARETGVSRSSLYGKLKALSGMAPNEFVVNYKIKKATLLLKNHPEMQISDIAYQLGFNTPRYFRHCFKAQIGMSPQEYRNEIK